MKGTVFRTFTIAIKAARRIEKLFLEGYVRGRFERSVLDSFGIVMQGAGHIGHFGQGPQMKGVHHGIHRSKNITVPFTRRPVHQVAPLHFFVRTDDQAIGAHVFEI